jgi:ribonuclease BN (tRNA processing enzyme)
MRIRILGAHQIESKETRLTSLLLNHRLALDAGSLGRSLTLQEQGRIQAVALTHRHYDHLRDLPTLGYAMAEGGPTIDLFGLPETLEDLRSHLLDGQLYPDFTQRPTPEAPRYRLCPVTSHQETTAAGLTLLPLAVPHGPPAVAYQVTDGRGRSLLFGGDGGPGLRQIWPYVDPELMILEVTYANRMEDPDTLRAHLTPAALELELRAYRDLRGTLPRIVATHFNPWHEADIREELAEVSKSLGTDIGIAEEDMVLEV